MEATTDGSPRRNARIAGVFYLLTIITGSLSLAFATRGAEGLGAAFNLASTGCYVGVTLLFFSLFKPAGRVLSGLAACFSGVGCTIAVLGVFQLAPTGISPLGFFGAYCLLIGILILRSTFLPRFVGWLMILGGLGWLTFLSPTLSAHLKPFNFLPGILGEVVLTVWLLVKGVDVERWRSQASAQGG